MLRNSSHHYGSIAKAFHWIMALMIIGLLAIGIYITDMAMSPDKIKFYGLHKATGIVALVLVFARLLWRFTNPSPSLPETMPAWQKLASHLSHFALYGLMLLMPLSGWLMSSGFGFPVSVYGLFTMPDLIAVDKEQAVLFKNIHKFGMIAFIGLLVVHVSAALMHHFYHKDVILKRMMPWGKP